jgi:lactobin A/cerein 7B family class IIb bacteriocin
MNTLNEVEVEAVNGGFILATICVVGFLIGCFGAGIAIGAANDDKKTIQCKAGG